MGDEQEKLRQECHADLDVLRTSGLDERTFRLFERLVRRLDRLETGTFSTTEKPTEPDPVGRVRKSSGAIPAFRAENVTRELEKGKKDNEG
jgi:hypothetical protein